MVAYASLKRCATQDALEATPCKQTERNLEQTKSQGIKTSSSGVGKQLFNSKKESVLF